VIVSRVSRVVVEKEATPDETPSGRTRTTLEPSPANRKRHGTCLAENEAAWTNKRGNATGSCSAEEKDADRDEEDPKAEEDTEEKKPETKTEETTSKSFSRTDGDKNAKKKEAPSKKVPALEPISVKIPQETPAIQSLQGHKPDEAVLVAEMEKRESAKKLPAPEQTTDKKLEPRNDSKELVDVEAGPTPASSTPGAKKRPDKQAADKHVTDEGEDVDVLEIAEWLMNDVISFKYNNIAEARLYARRIIAFGAHSAEMIVACLEPNDVEAFTWMKPLHRRRLMKVLSEK
jgi:hypothetical protein